MGGMTLSKLLRIFWQWLVIQFRGHLTKISDQSVSNLSNSHLKSGRRLSLLCSNSLHSQSFCILYLFYSRDAVWSFSLCLETHTHAHIQYSGLGVRCALCATLQNSIPVESINMLGHIPYLQSSYNLGVYLFLFLFHA